MQFFFRRICLAPLTAAALLCSLDAAAQFDGLFASSRKSRKSKANVPTIVNADAMDMDIARNQVVLLGNVDVQDPEMNIKCRKMVIYLGDAGDGNDLRLREKNRRVVRIECIDDVVITRAADKSAGRQEIQQAFAGKAVYLVKDDTITLTLKPVVVNGPNRLEGEQITLYTKTDRVLVLKPHSRIQGAVISAGQAGE